MNIRTTDNDIPISLVIALVLSPFTMLRFSFFGFTEIILLLFFIFSFKRFIKTELWRQFIFTRFWILFIFISLLGLAYNTLILGGTTGTIKGTIFDLSSYIFICLVCYLLEMKFLEKKICPLKLLKLFYLYLTILFIILYVLSLFFTSILGLPLRYEGSFAPLVINIHQSAMVLITLPFIGMFLYKYESSFINKAMILISILLLYILALDTAATKAIMGIFIGTAVFLIFSLKSMFSKKAVPVLLLCMIGGGIVLVLQFNLIELALTFFEENDGGGARGNLYLQGLLVGMTSPIIGLGAGGHIYYDQIFYDAHQTQLTVFLQAGVLGVILYILLMYKIIRTCALSSAFIACIFAISIYSFGGDILRRLPIWLILLLIYYSAKRLTNNLN